MPKYVVIEDDVEIFESTHSTKLTGTVSVGTVLTSGGEPEMVSGYKMLPLFPDGAVQADFVELLKEPLTN